MTYWQIAIRLLLMLLPYFIPTRLRKEAEAKNYTLGFEHGVQQAASTGYWEHDGVQAELQEVRNSPIPRKNA